MTYNIGDKVEAFTGYNGWVPGTIVNYETWNEFYHVHIPSMGKTFRVAPVDLCPVEDDE